VQPDDVRFEMGQYRDPSDARLHEHEKPQSKAQPEQFRARFAQPDKKQEREERHNGNNSAHESIGEFHYGVETKLGGWNQ
jgi:hypothetical protein